MNGLTATLKEPASLASCSHHLLDSKGIKPVNPKGNQPWIFIVRTDAEAQAPIFFFHLILFFNYTILYWFCHISTWICHRYTHVPHPEPSSLPVPSLWVVPVHQPQASSIMHRTWTGNSFHIWYYTCFSAILPNHPTLSLSHRVQKTVLYISVPFAVSYTGLYLVTIFLNSIYMR